MPMPPADPAIAAKIVAAREAGLSVAALAERFGCSRSTIRNLLDVAQRRPAQQLAKVMTGAGRQP